jgi:hypothetical protein
MQIMVFFFPLIDNVQVGWLISRLMVVIFADPAVGQPANDDAVSSSEWKSAAVGNTEDSLCPIVSSYVY